MRFIYCCIVFIFVLRTTFGSKTRGQSPFKTVRARLHRANDDGTSFTLHGSQESNKIFTGIPKHIIKQNLLHLDLHYVELDPDYLISSIADCVNLESFKLTNYVARGNFTKRIRLPKLTDFVLDIPSGFVKWDSTSSIVLKSLIFFDKDTPWEFKDIASLNTNISILPFTGSVLVVNHAEGRIESDEHHIDKILCGLQTSNTDFGLKILRSSATYEILRPNVKLNCVDWGNLEILQLDLNLLDANADLNSLLGRTTNKLRELELLGVEGSNVDLQLQLGRSLTQLTLSGESTSYSASTINFKNLQSLACSYSILDVSLIPASLIELKLIHCNLLGATLNEIILKTPKLERLTVVAFGAQTIDLAFLPRKTIKYVYLHSFDSISYNNGYNTEGFQQWTSLHVFRSVFSLNSPLPSTITMLEIDQRSTNSPSELELVLILGHLTNLKAFTLSGAQTTTVDIAKLQPGTLQELTLNKVQIIQSVPVQFKQLTSIVLADCILNGDLTSLSAPTVVSFDISWAQVHNLSDIIKPGLNLKHAHISGVDTIDLALLSPNTLEDLEIGSASNVIESTRTEFKRLEILHLDSVEINITTPLPESLLMARLDLSSVDESFCSLFKTTGNVRELSINIREYASFDLSCLKAAKSLEYLKLKSEDVIKSDATLTFPKLESLNFEAARLASNFLTNLTFPALLKVESLTVPDTFAYPFLEQLLFHTCAVSISLYNVDRYKYPDDPNKYDEVDHVLAGFGVDSNDTTVEMWRSKCYELPERSQTRSEFADNPILDEDHTCADDGYFGFGHRSGGFYRCVKLSSGKYKRFEFECGHDTVFDERTSTCVHPWAL